MTSIDDSTQTPPGYWFGVIEGRLHQHMRDTLADLGLRRGAWRILHTLAEGPASADELAERLPHGDRKPGRAPFRDFGDFGGGRGRAHGYGRHPGWRSQEPRDEREVADHGRRPDDHHERHHEDAGHDHRQRHDEAAGHDHRHGGHEHVFERGYERGFDRGFALGALRGPHGCGQHGAPFAAHGRPLRHHEGRGEHRIQHVLAAFVERGWVWFDGDRATLTDEGRAAHDAAFERVETVRAELMDGIPDADYATTMATLEAMARNLGWRPGDGESSPEDGQAGAPSMDA